MNAPRRLLSWLEDRSGLGSALREWATTPVQGPRWSRSPGVVLLLLILMQVVTGVTLAAHYSPGTTTAWGSVFHIEEQVVLGSFIRGLHAFGASAIVVLLIVHVVTAGLRRAYRTPHELTWILGLLAVPLLLAFALTGYLLPWDQRGYWATQVAAGIMAGTPLVGDLAATLFLGGEEMGNLTLTRFFALHTVVLPLCLALLIGLHIRVRRRCAAQALTKDQPTIPWWPNQALRDLVAFSAVLIVVGLMAGLEGAGLEAPADPTSDYPPRPEWYFAPMRELLKSVPEPWGSVVLPGILFLLVGALPWIDVDPGRRPRAARAILLGPLAVWLGLLGFTTLQDQKDADFQERSEVAEAEAAFAKDLARDGIPGQGAGYMVRMHPPRHGKRLFVTHCQECHKVGGKGGEEGPNLNGYGSERWLRGMIQDPDHARYFGKHEKLKDSEYRMPKLPEALEPELKALVAYMRSLDPSTAGLDPKLVAEGREAYTRTVYPDQNSCHECHGAEPFDPEEGTSGGPNHHGYGSEEWLLEFLKNPKSQRFYHEYAEMPGFAKELSEVELQALVAYLRTLREPR